VSGRKGPGHRIRVLVVFLLVLGFFGVCGLFFFFWKHFCLFLWVGLGCFFGCFRFFFGGAQTPKLDVGAKVDFFWGVFCVVFFVCMGLIFCGFYCWFFGVVWWVGLFLEWFGPVAWLFLGVLGGEVFCLVLWGGGVGFGVCVWGLVFAVWLFWVALCNLVGVWWSGWEILGGGSAPRGERKLRQ